MKRFQKVYLEISNRCNLSCSFCPGTKRPAGAMDEEHFACLLDRLVPWTDYLYFHLMGEPLCHPELERFLMLAGEKGFRVILTTNGTLLPRQQEMLLTAPALHKINISLHAFEANDLNMSFYDYLDGCFAFGMAAQGKKLVVYRLWNEGGADARNPEILQHLEHFFPKPWGQERRGVRLGEKIYLEYGDKFDWPDLAAPDGGERVFCYGLKDQIGVLWDGTVVPCCLDHEGDISLGNVFEQELGDILAGHRAQNICRGFEQGVAAEELCRKCGFARKRFG
ncbi:MAG: radical SAM protein [Ruminococcaceae bacterium]|nr:radical SAM protein [Oscillospiraceae bacterium]